MQDLFDEKGSLNTIKKGGKLRRERDFILHDLVLAMALCHNVTPVGEGQDRTFQASSPDEIALVKVCESFGVQLISRDQASIVLGDMHGQQHRYEILNNFPFSSETKRMGTILRHEGSDRYLFYLKGADSVMKQFIHET